MNDYIIGPSRVAKEWTLAGHNHHRQHHDPYSCVACWQGKGVAERTDAFYKTAKGEVLQKLLCR
jgi:hypothetical protein